MAAINSDLLAKIQSAGFNMAITRAATVWATTRTGESRGDYITNAAIEYLTGSPGTWQTAVDLERGVGFLDD